MRLAHVGEKRLSIVIGLKDAVGDEPHGLFLEKTEHVIQQAGTGRLLIRRTLGPHELAHEQQLMRKPALAPTALVPNALVVCLANPILTEAVTLGVAGAERHEVAVVHLFYRNECVADLQAERNDVAGTILIKGNLAREGKTDCDRLAKAHLGGIRALLERARIQFVVNLGIQLSRFQLQAKRFDKASDVGGVIVNLAEIEPHVAACRRPDERVVPMHNRIRRARQQRDASAVLERKQVALHAAADHFLRQNDLVVESLQLGKKSRLVALEVYALQGKLVLLEFSEAPLQVCHQLILDKLRHESIFCLVIITCPINQAGKVIKIPTRLHVLTLNAAARLSPAIHVLATGNDAHSHLVCKNRQADLLVLADDKTVIKNQKVLYATGIEARGHRHQRRLAAPKQVNDARALLEFVVLPMCAAPCSKKEHGDRHDVRFLLMRLIEIRNTGECVLRKQVVGI